MLFINLRVLDQSTSMADIAREAGVARTTLYLRFSEKCALFEASAASLVDEALARAEAAWVPDAPLSENIAATLLATDLGFFHILHATPHGAELMKLDGEQTAAHAPRLDAEFTALLAKRGRQVARDGADLTAFPDANGLRCSWRRPARASSTRRALRKSFVYSPIA